VGVVELLISLSFYFSHGLVPISAVWRILLLTCLRPVGNFFASVGPAVITASQRQSGDFSLRSPLIGSLGCTYRGRFSARALVPPAMPIVGIRSIHGGVIAGFRWSPPGGQASFIRQFGIGIGVNAFFCGSASSIQKWRGSCGCDLSIGVAQPVRMPSITVESLSKRYLLGHNSTTGVYRYTELRDVHWSEALTFARKASTCSRATGLPCDEVDEFLGRSYLIFESSSKLLASLAEWAPAKHLLRNLSRITGRPMGAFLVSGACSRACLRSGRLSSRAHGCSKHLPQRRYSCMTHGDPQ